MHVPILGVEQVCFEWLCWNICTGKGISQPGQSHRYHLCAHQAVGKHPTSEHGIVALNTTTLESNYSLGHHRCPVEHLSTACTRYGAPQADHCTIVLPPNYTCEHHSSYTKSDAASSCARRTVPAQRGSGEPIERICFPHSRRARPADAITRSAIAITRCIESSDCDGVSVTSVKRVCWSQEVDHPRRVPVVHCMAPLRSSLSWYPQSHATMMCRQLVSENLSRAGAVPWWSSPL